MAEVQKLPRAQVKFISRHHIPLDLHTLGNDLPDLLLRLIPEQKLLQRALMDKGVFDHLRPALGIDLRGQGVQAVGVADHQPGLGENAHLVFARRKIDGGFAAHGGIHRRKQGGGKLNAGDAPLIQGRRQSRHVPGDAAAQSEHRV